MNKKYLLAFLMIMVLSLTVISAGSWFRISNDNQGTGFTTNSAPINISNGFITHNVTLNRGANSPPSIDGDFVYFSDGDGSSSTLYQNNRSNVSQTISTFSILSGFFCFGGPWVASDALGDTYVYAGCQDGFIHQLNATNISQEIANFSTGGPISKQGLVTGGFLYIMNNGGTIYQVNATNVSQLITSNSESGSGLSTPSVDLTGNFILYGIGTTLFKGNATNISDTLGSFAAGGNVFREITVGGNVTFQDYVYIGNDAGNDVIQVYINNMSERARFDTGGAVHTPPKLGNGYIYSVSQGGTYRQHDANNVSIVLNSIALGDMTESSSLTEDFAYVVVRSPVFDVIQLNATNVSIEISRFDYTSEIPNVVAIADGSIWFGTTGFGSTFASGNFYQVGDAPATLTVTLDSPANNTVSTVSEVELVCTAEVATDLTEEGLTNMTLYTNESGGWGAKNVTTFPEGLLLSYYTLDELSGTIIDATGNIDAINQGSTYGAVGKIDTAHSFDGVDDVINGTANTEISGSDNRSICAWYNLTDTTDEYIVTIGGSGAGNGFVMKVATNITVDYFGTSTVSNFTASLNTFEFACVTYNGTQTRIYGNGNLVAVENKGAITTTNSPIFIGAGGAAIDAGYVNGIIDEVSLWDITINDSTVQNLYASGVGSRPIELNSSIQASFNRTISSTILWSCQACIDSECLFAAENRTLALDEVAPNISIEAPTGLLNFSSVGDNETLNVTFTDTNLDTCWFDYNGTNITIDGCISGVKNSTQFILEANNLNLTVYANDTAGNVVSNFTSWGYSVLEGNLTFNSSLLVSELGTYIVEFESTNTTLTDPLFFFNGVSQIATLVEGIDDNFNMTTTRIATEPDVGNRTFFFSITADGIQINLTGTNQTINDITLINCSEGNVSSYLHVDFIDETNLTNLNATVSNSIWSFWVEEESAAKSFFFTSTVEQPTYDFCFSPTTVTYNVDVEFPYAAADFPQRVFRADNLILVNTSTTNKTLFLLGSSEGFFTTYVAINSLTGSAVENVEVIVQKDISGIPETVSQGFTDATGQTILFLDPDDLHTFTFTLEGFEVSEFTIRPASSSPYNIAMIPTGTGDAGNGTNIVVDLFTSIGPEQLTLAPNTTFTFTFSVNRSGEVVDNFTMQLFANQSLIFNQTITSANGTISTNLNTSSNTSINGIYTIFFGNETLQFVRTWTIVNITSGDFSIKSWLLFADDLAFNSLWWNLFRYITMMLLLLGIYQGFYHLDPFDSTIGSIVASVMVVWLVGSVGLLSINTPAGDAIDKIIIPGMYSVVMLSFLVWRYNSQ